MLNALYDAMAPLAARHPGFLYVDARKVLSRRYTPVAELFHDRIHPISKSFAKVMGRIEKEARAAGVWPA